MRKLAVVLVLASMLLVFLATASAQEMMMPGADGAALLEYILETNPYTGWYVVTGDISDFLPSQSPHGPVVRIFVNEVAEAALTSPDFDDVLPYGSIIVKEAYQTEGATPENPGDVTALTVMYKVEGYDPDNGDWLWLAAAPDGSEIMAEGAVEMCIECHAQEGNVDYTLFPYGEAEFVMKGMVMPGADGAALLEYILETSPYTEWSYVVDAGGSDFLPSQSPHGPVVRVFLDDPAAEALYKRTMDMMGEGMSESEMMEAALPYGSIIVKEAYQTEGATPENPGDVTALTVMYKVEGYDPDDGDWFWLAAAPDGSAVNAEGAVEMCIQCHAQEGNYDYTLLGYSGNLTIVLREALMKSMMMPGADGAALLDYILKTRPYTDWPLFDPDHEFLASQSPHGPVVRAFVNEVGAAAITAMGEDMGMIEAFAWPYGTIIVKEAYQTEGATPENPGDMTALTVMYKVEGYDPDNGDWFWLAAAPDGSAVNAEGAVEMCIQCHAQEGNSDYALLPKLLMEMMGGN